MTTIVPVVTDVSYQDLLDDPYPAFRRLRDTAPAVFVDAAKLTLVTRFDDITRIERDPARDVTRLCDLRGWTSLGF